MPICMTALSFVKFEVIIAIYLFTYLFTIYFSITYFYNNRRVEKRLFQQQQWQSCS